MAEDNSAQNNHLYKLLTLQTTPVKTKLVIMSQLSLFYLQVQLKEHVEIILNTHKDEQFDAFCDSRYLYFVAPMRRFNKISHMRPTCSEQSSISLFSSNTLSYVRYLVLVMLFLLRPIMKRVIAERVSYSKGEASRGISKKCVACLQKYSNLQN